MRKKLQDAEQLLLSALPTIDEGKIYVVTSLEEEADLLRLLLIRKEWSAQNPAVHKQKQPR